MYFYIINERAKTMTDILLNKLVINATIKCESYTQNAVASYVIFLKVNGVDAVKDLRKTLKESKALTDDNKGAVNKRIKTAVAILTDKAEDITAAFTNAENDYKKALQTIADLIKTNSWTYYNLVQEKAKIQSPKDSNTKALDAFKQFYKYLTDSETSELMLELLANNGFTLQKQEVKKAA